MQALLSVLIVVAIVLGIITLLGHGMWLLLAAIFGAGRKKSQRKCVFCGRLTSTTAARCDWCGRDLANSVAVELADIEAVQRQLLRLRGKGALRPEAVDDLTARLLAYRQELLTPLAKNVAQAQAAEAAIWPIPTEPATQPQAAESIKPPTVAPVAAPHVAASTAIPPVIAERAKPAAPVPAEPRSWDVAAQPPKAATPATPWAILDETRSPVAAAAPRPVEPAKPVAPARPQAPRAPRRSWTEVLAGFMEQRNIRWGELVGGLLVVCSSVALVISFWEQLQENPYYKLGIFVTVSAAVFGVGLYAHHRWKLRTTSQGMLVIATLLVPLNSMAMAGLLKDESLPMALLVGVACLGFFAWLTSLAAHVLVAPARWLAVLAIIGNSAAVLVVWRHITPDSPAWLLVGLGALPVALFALAIAGHLFRGASLQLAKARGASFQLGNFQLDVDAITVLFTLLGITAFSMAVAIAMLVAKAVRPPHVAMVLQQLSVLLSAAAVPVLAVGLTVVRGTRRDKSLGAYHMAGTMLAMVSMIAMLVAIGLAWPQPGWLIAVASLDAAVLALAAFRWRLPVLHGGAMACATLAYLVAFHWITGHWTADGDLWSEILSARSGTALAGPFLLFAAVSELLARFGHRRHGVFYMGGAAAVAVVGLMLVTFFGFRYGGKDALRAAILYAVYGAGCLGLVARWRRVELSYLGLALMALAPLWALWQHTATHHIGPLWGAVVAGEALLMAAAAAALHRVFGGLWDDLVARFYEQAMADAAGDLKSASDRVATPAPRRRRSVADLYRLPLAQLSELLAVLGILLTVATCWLDQAAILDAATPAPLISAALLAATWFLLACQYRSAWRTWAASLIVLAGAAHTLRFNYTGLVPASWVVAFLGHSSAAIAAAFAIRSRTTRHLDFLTQPLADSALLASVLALPALVFTRSPGTWWLAVCFPWLAAIWLILAWQKRNVLLFAAHQAALAFGALATATVWLKSAGWVVSRADLPPSPNLLERIAAVAESVLAPPNLQVYAIALGVLSIVWIVVRIVGRALIPTAGDHTQPVEVRTTNGARLLQTSWTVDRVIRHIVVAGQFILLALCVLPPEAAKELGLPGAVSVANAAEAFGPAAWLLLAVLGVMLVAAMWERWQETELVSTVLLAAGVPCAVAGRAMPDLAVASLWRWGLALAFAAVSIAIWQRQRLLELCRACGTNVRIGRDGPRAARAVLVLTTALPVLFITLLAAMLQLSNTTPGGPLTGTWFAKLGPEWSYLVPLALVMAALVGFALRERSSGYAFSAGLVLEMAVVLGYALRRQTIGGDFEPAFQVTLLQLATITAGVWAIVWLVARKWVDVWREGACGAGVPPATVMDADLPAKPAGETPAPQKLPAVLMNVQIGMAEVGNVLLIGWALLTLVFAHPNRQEWTEVAGSPLGWVALALPLVALQLRGRIRSHAVGLLGMAAMGLLACTVRGLEYNWNLGEPVWGYRTLMLGWAVYALLVVLATWWVASLRTLPDAHGPPQALVRLAAVWVRVAAIAAVLLGLKTAFWDTWFRGTEEQLWAAAAIAVASAAGATVAVWRRREGWAFAAALGVNLAASIAVWHFQYRQSFEDWWVRLVQANTIASAAVALVWLAARKRLYELRDLTVSQSPLLAVQTGLSAMGNLAILLLPVLSLARSPQWLPPWMAELAAPAGWVGLLLTFAAVAWYLRQTSPDDMPSAIGLLVLGLGVLVACFASHPSLRSASAWLAYHLLLTSWAAGAVLLLGLGMAAEKWKWGRSVGASLHPGLLPEREGEGWSIRFWLTFIGVLVVVFAVLHSFHDPGRPWWSARAVLAMSVAAGLSALWLRQAANVYVSGLLINLAGLFVWWAWRPDGNESWTSLLQTNILCLAVGSAIWSLLDRFFGVPHPFDDSDPRAAGSPPRLPFAHLAAMLGAGLAALVVLIGVITDLADLPHLAVDRLDWLALAAIVTAVAICLIDRTAHFASPALYGLGLAAVGMALWWRDFSPRALCWSAGVALAAFALATAVLAWLLARRRDWFSQSQAVIATLGAGLGAWVTVDFAFDKVEHPIALFSQLGRITGAAAVLVSLAAAVVMSAGPGDKRRAAWQHLTFALSVLLLSAIGWAFLSSDVLVLHRCVVLMVAAAAITLLAGFGMKGVPGWAESGRRSVPALAVLALLSLGAVLAQEGLLYSKPDGVPMEPWGIAVVAAALAGLIGGCLAFAVGPALDPLKLSDRGRQAYVYAAEVIGVLIALHIYFTMPWLFHGFIRRFWMFVAMAVAFAGAGLSEWFRRRKLPVLSQPLERTAVLLPLLPAIGFWFTLEPGSLWGITGRTPLLWWLMGLFYGIMAVTRRSVLCTGLAVLAANLGIWVALSDGGISFLLHPQLWLVPLALAALVAEYFHRDRLTDEQRSAFRYLALSVIYVSSTAEMYIDWSRTSEWEWILPLVLMVFSVAGVLAGIMMRVRSFLYLGVTFLTLDLLSMVCHTAVKYPWVWYASGVALGAAIIALFAVFEKRRNDVLAAMERLQGWR